MARRVRRLLSILDFPKTHVPHSAALLYFIIMLYIVLGILNEIRPVWYYIFAAVLFVLSQLDYFLLNKVICNVRRPLLSAQVDRTHAKL